MFQTLTNYDVDNPIPVVVLPGKILAWGCKADFTLKYWNNLRDTTCAFTVAVITGNILLGNKPESANLKHP